LKKSERDDSSIVVEPIDLDKFSLSHCRSPTDLDEIKEETRKYCLVAELKKLKLHEVNE
jgi:hypothetical protein